MSEKNFMEAGTEIEGIIDKKDQCLSKIANVLAEACVTRAKNKKFGNIEKDIDNLINSLPLEDQVVVLRRLSVNLAHQISGGSPNRNSNNSGSSRMNNIFANRGF